MEKSKKINRGNVNFDLIQLALQRMTTTSR